jgi:hypothetical protein
MATPITVVAGGTQIADFLLEYNSSTAPTRDMLSVMSAAPGAPPYASPRGLMISPKNGQTVSVKFFVGGLKANTVCTLLSGANRALSLSNGQLQEVTNQVGTATANGLGVATFALMLPGAPLTNTFYQAMSGTGAQTTFTNVVNVWANTQ